MYRSPSDRFKIMLDYAYGIDAIRSHGRGANSVGVLLQWDLGQAAARGFPPRASRSLAWLAVVFRRLKVAGEVLGVRTCDSLRKAPSLGLLCKRVRIWWNWQTRYFEVVVPKGVQVQVLLCAPIFLNKLRFLVFLTQS